MGFERLDGLMMVGVGLNVLLTELVEFKVRRDHALSKGFTFGLLLLEHRFDLETLSIHLIKLGFKLGYLLVPQLDFVLHRQEDKL